MSSAELLVQQAASAMVSLPGGSFLMGSDEHYPEEAPIRQASVTPFMIDKYPVTNGAFAAFVQDTGYVTLAEIPPDVADYPGMPLEMARAGSAVFIPPEHQVCLDDPGQWWHFVFGANWRHPQGPNSSIRDKMLHPVVHVAYQDALAYALWCGKSLPTEAEHEYASRGGLLDKAYAWGDELTPEGIRQANFWVGNFPHHKEAGRFIGTTSPVDCFRPNGFGLHDLIGNVWEWTDDWYHDSPAQSVKTCCSMPIAQLATEAQSREVRGASGRFPRKVLKGGSHLCAENYCRRYRPAARHPQQIESPTSHIGFRCVKRF